MAERGGWERFLAGALLIAMLATLAIGSPVGRPFAAQARLDGLTRFSRLAWTVSTTPWRLRLNPVDMPSALGVTMLVLVLVSLLAGTVTGFTTLWTSVGAFLIVGTIALAFASTATRTNTRQERARLLAGSMGPLLPGVMLLCALMTYVGPLGFWYFFWTSSFFRVALVTCGLAVPIWTISVMVDVRAGEGWRGRAGGMLAAAGAALIGLTVLLPDWVSVFRALDHPLNFAPATDTMLFALRTYAGVNLDISRGSYLLGALLLASGYSIWLSVVHSSLRRRLENGRGLL